MRVYFVGIGGAGLSPLALLAQDVGFDACGSDGVESLGTQELSTRGVLYSLDQSGEYLQSVHADSAVDLLVYSSAISSNHPELVLASSLGIRCIKRSELINIILKEKKLKLLAVAGTHGKTTTTAMVVWLFQQAGIPVSYSIGSQVSFGPSAQYVLGSTWFVYECDEFDRNFLDFYPHISVVTTIDYDHPDTYSTQEEYCKAFDQFMSQSEEIVRNDSKLVIPELTLQGVHNRENASSAIRAFGLAVQVPVIDSRWIDFINRFPGTKRRFERLSERVYTDYAHHPIEIQATIQLATELYDRVVIVYQPHQNIRQYAVRGQYDTCFLGAEKVFWLPTYLSREDDRRVLTAQELVGDVRGVPVVMSELNDNLFQELQAELSKGACIVAMGAGSVDEWMRRNFLEIK